MEIRPVENWQLKAILQIGGDDPPKDEVGRQRLGIQRRPIELKCFQLVDFV